MRTFLRDHSLRNKKIAIYACCSGGTADKYFAQVKEESKATEVMATDRFVDPLKNAGEELDRKIKEICDKWEEYRFGMERSCFLHIVML